MPKPSLEQLAAAYQAQQGAQSEPKKEKKKTLTETVNETFQKYVVNPIVSIPKYAAKGVNYTERFSSSFIRTSVPMTYATVAALPLIAINPIGAVIAGLSVLAISYITTNTLYKLVRDGIYLPKNIYNQMRLMGGNAFKHPIKAITAIATAPLKAPFQLFKYAFTYPLTSAKRYSIGVDQQGNKKKVVIGGVSPLGHRLGLLAGPAAGLYLASGVSGLTELVSVAKEKITSFGTAYDYNSVKSYMPNLRLV